MSPGGETAIYPTIFQDEGFSYGIIIPVWYNFNRRRGKYEVHLSVRTWGHHGSGVFYFQHVI
jgi:hypothetical protein